MPENWTFYFDEASSNPGKQGLALLTKEEVTRLPSSKGGSHVLVSHKSFEVAGRIYPHDFAPFDATPFYRAIGISDGTISTPTRKEMAEALNHEDWVLFCSNDENEPLWLGKVLNRNDWNAKPTWTNKSTSNKSVPGTVVGKNEVALNVIWYEQTQVGSCLEYHVSREYPCAFPQNFKYLVHSKFHMQKVQGKTIRGPKPGIFDGPDLSKLPNREMDWYLKEYPLVWRMDQGVYDQVLRRCGL